MREGNLHMLRFTLLDLIRHLRLLPPPRHRDMPLARQPVAPVTQGL